MRKLILFAIVVAAYVGSASQFLSRWEFVENLSLVRLERLSQPPLSSDNICRDLPRIDYVREPKLELPEENDKSPLAEVIREGYWAVRPIHVWGVYSEIGCKEPLGWGTAFLLGMYKDKMLWVTVEHNIVTSKYFQSAFGRVIATNWFVQDDDGTFKELFPIACKDGKFCVLISSYVAGTFPISLDDDIVKTDAKILEKTYLFGCSLVPETIRRYRHYRVWFFCLANEGYVNSREAIDTLIGGDVLISNPAMPGFSGSPVFIVRDDTLKVLGTVNAGVEGVFTAINLLEEDTVSKVIDWLRRGEDLWRGS